jgi:DNA-binding NtrC family response regulator
MLEVYNSYVNGQIQQAKEQIKAKDIKLSDFVMFLGEEIGLTAKETLRVVVPLFTIETTTKPDPSLHCPSPLYIREVLVSKNLNNKQAARAIGMPNTTFSDKMRKGSFTYCEQYTLESL